MPVAIKNKPGPRLPEVSDSPEYCFAIEFTEPIASIDAGGDIGVRQRGSSSSGGLGIVLRLLV